MVDTTLQFKKIIRCELCHLMKWITISSTIRCSCYRLRELGVTATIVNRMILNLDHLTVINDTMLWWWRQQSMSDCRESSTDLFPSFPFDLSYSDGHLYWLYWLLWLGGISYMRSKRPPQEYFTLIHRMYYGHVQSVEYWVVAHIFCRMWNASCDEWIVIKAF